MAKQLNYTALMNAARKVVQAGRAADFKPPKPGERHEIFNFMGLCFDVEWARYIVNDGREPSETRVDHLYKSYWGDPNEEPDPNVIYLMHVDHEYAMSDAVDLMVPLIAVSLRLGGETDRLLIDGHHRIYKAVRQGIRYLPAHILTPEESFAVRDL